MTHYESLSIDEYWSAVITWSYPKKWDRRSVVDVTGEATEECGIYRFERSHRLRDDDERELTYIGIAHSQFLAVRLAQHGVDKLDKWRKRGDLFVSYGIITLADANHVRSRYEEIEHLFIYFLKPVENERKWGSAPHGSYRITNEGSRGVLPREITYPLARIVY